MPIFAPNIPKIMMKNMKRYLMHLACAVFALVAMTSCEGFEVNWGNGGNGDNGEDVVSVELARCWHLVSFCGVEAEADIYIDLGKDGKFAIYQRTEELEYTVFNGTYTADEENSLLQGVYSDGEAWASSYHYTVDKEAKTLTLESVERPSEVSIYELSKVPASATANTRSASASDVKPL